MARIPTIINEPGRDVMPDSGRPAMSSPDTFGAQVGEAQIRGGQQTQAAGTAMGAAITGLGVAAGNYFQADKKKQDDSATASGVANYDFTSDYLELQKQGAPDAADFQQRVANAYDAKVDKYIEGMPSDEVRNRVKQQLMSQKPRYIDAAANFSNKAATANDRLQADSGLTTQINAVGADPAIDTYNDALTKGYAVLDARPNFTPGEREIAKKTYAEQLALSRFQGLLRDAHDDPATLAAIENELTVKGSPWQSVLSGEGYRRTLDKVVTLKQAASSQESTAARSALSSVSQRNNDGVEIDPAELSAVQDTVVRSKNPALISQFAMVQKQQSIYREHKGLPLDQQRAKLEEYRKAKGIAALPEPVKLGINEGTSITGGQISVEYLAGLVNFEYGQHLASGDYGKGTGSTNPDGTAGSDAAGVAQFTSGTWRSTVQRHAAALGINPNATAAEIEAMRVDKTEAGAMRQIKAAALHALDNKQELETRTGRTVNDGDLYFAHFLGVGGATRFLNAATQNPNALATTSVAPEQVAANRGVFYDEQGRPRTNAAVRSFVANASMNGPSRVDYAGVKAATLVYNNTVKGLKDDAVTFAASTGRFGDVGSLTSAEGIERRGVVVGQIAEYYSTPASEIKPFTKSEAEDLARKARDGTAEETLQVIQQIQGLRRPDLIKAGNKQIGEKDALFGYAAGLAYAQPDQFGVAADVIRGEKRIKEDKDVMATIGQTESELQSAFTKVVGKSLAATTHGTTIRKAALAHYVERQLSRGGAQPGRFDGDLFDESIQAVLGGNGNPGKRAIDNVNGAPTLLPRGLNAGDFDRALDRATVEDYTALSKWGGPPRYADGKVISPDEISREGKFETLGGGEYRIKMGDGKYALSVAKADGSADFYIFRGDPERLKAMAMRSNDRDRNVLPEMSPGNTPARPRVIE